jgi:hypothetical protein
MAFVSHAEGYQSPLKYSSQHFQTKQFVTGSSNSSSLVDIILRELGKMKNKRSNRQQFICLGKVLLHKFRIPKRKASPHISNKHKIIHSSIIIHKLLSSLQVFVNVLVDQRNCT